MSGFESVKSNIESLLKTNQGRDHRLLIVISGSREWCQRCIPQQQSSLSRWAWIGDPAVGIQPPSIVRPVSAKQAHQLLGQESDCVLFDGWSGFNPNGFGQVVGTLVAGGAFILVTPLPEVWERFSDPEYQHIAVEPYTEKDVGRCFIRHLINTIAADDQLMHFSENSLLPEISDFASLLATHRVKQVSVDLPFKSADQALAVNNALTVMARARAVRVVTADRGRGKSAALGIIAARLMTGGPVEIVLTAPSRSAVQSAFAMIEMLLPVDQLIRDRDSWMIGQSRLRFILPDLLIQQRPAADLLLVDEAAAIPAPVLLNMLDYQRVIFASTLHGYEGTGQGFAVRFLPLLDKKVPEWELLRMEQPVRWAENDPLERFSYKALLLDAEPVKLSTDQQDLAVGHESLSFRRLDSSQLVGNTPLLKQLFGLLILAHYRTTPGDLRILLDSPNVQVWAGFIVTNGEEQLIATALLATEGPIAPELAEAILSGTRRPKGQLIPQTLLAHSQIPEAAACRGLRVMRIAVHPALQQRGIGTALFKAIEQGVPDIDWLGTSFGATPTLCDFWQSLGLRLQRLGFNRDKVSGTHAAIMLKGVTEAGCELQQKGTCRAQQQWQQDPAIQAVAAAELADVFIF
ncbi:tRNA(Met) cytidine acetyltransferase TmcA [Amphritea japonica]|uniref:tRNA(Met) cytidine acetyltransferase TmcA n=1 Tax=Amphritea japonica ATCC BAA-1530 TaxID=1278309 RepID=A0A7R6PNI8_9GAMM|nr:GNAT family N-acetyltransferase [Amphritea japonica]BBB26653.1 tRNA(Met) cytidine acetyltransferase [Amphritea japonica ATCC BAA-1530]